MHADMNYLNNFNNMKHNSTQIMFSFFYAMHFGFKDGGHCIFTKKGSL